MSDQPKDETREQALDRRAKEMEQLQSQHPEVDLQLGKRWWEPEINFLADVKDALGQEALDKMSAILGEKSGSSDPDARVAALAEMRKSFASHDGLLEQYDDIFGKVTPGAWDLYKGMAPDAQRQEM